MFLEDILQTVVYNYRVKSQWVAGKRSLQKLYSHVLLKLILGLRNHKQTLFTPHNCSLKKCVENCSENSFVTFLKYESNYILNKPRLPRKQDIEVRDVGIELYHGQCKRYVFSYIFEIMK